VSLTAFATPSKLSPTTSFTCCASFATNESLGDALFGWYGFTGLGSITSNPGSVSALTPFLLSIVSFGSAYFSFILTTSFGFFFPESEDELSELLESSDSLRMSSAVKVLLVIIIYLFIGLY
jgi:hypothetical protein